MDITLAGGCHLLYGILLGVCDMGSTVELRGFAVGPQAVKR